MKLPCLPAYQLYLFSKLCNKFPQFSGSIQHTFITSQFLHLLSGFYASGLIRLQYRCWLGLHSHQGLNWGGPVSRWNSSLCIHKTVIPVSC